jgi:hypothetical protein
VLACALPALSVLSVAGVVAQAAGAAPIHHAVRRHGVHHRSYTRRRASHVKRLARHPGQASPGLVFGIYPGGAAGTVGPSGAPKPEDPAKRLAAIEQLRSPGNPFVLHIYASYTGPGGWSVQQQVGQQIDQYTAAGFHVEIALTYRPSTGGSSADAAGFAAFVRDTVRALGANRGFVSLQVANEVNVAGAPNASDGFYADAKDAMIEGVIAAKQEAVADGFAQLAVGINWAASGGSDDAAFWSYLGSHGGPTFVNALDWVGLDAYPGTWGPLTGGISSGTATAIDAILKSLRGGYLPLAGVPARVPLHVSENGYPTGPGRTEAMQVAAMRAAITTLDQARLSYNLTDYRWFDLRDADSAGQSFESQYGIMHDDYTPKPAFDVYRNLVAALSAPH